MLPYFSQLLKIQKTICYPNQKFYPDPEEFKEIYLYNLERLKSHLNFFILYFIISLGIDLQSEHHIVWLGLNLTSFISFLSFCRTRVKVYRWTYTLFVTFGQIIFIEIDRNCFLHSLVISFLSPLYVLDICKDLNQAILSFCFQMFFLHFRYKPLLQEVVQEMSPQDFAEKIINAATLLLICSILIYSVQFKDLRNTHKNLHISKQEAENSYTKLQLFLQTFSHELRNPLNSLMGNLQLLLQETLSPTSLEMIESAKVCSDLLLQLINNILDSGKAQLGKLDVSPSFSRLSDFVGGFWRISRHLIKKKRLNGFLKLDRQLPPVLFFDFYRLNQVLLNLVSNAVKFTDKGRIWIKLSWMPNESLSEKCFTPQPYDDNDDEGVYEKNENFKLTSIGKSDGNTLLYLDSTFDELRGLSEGTLSKQPRKGVLKMIVEDTGIGMSKESLEKLFTKFSQVSDDPTKRRVGAGLGLYITREICEQMGGEIRAYSRPGTGSSFIVCIPTHCPGQDE